MATSHGWRTLALLFTMSIAATSCAVDSPGSPTSVDSTRSALEINAPTYAPIVHQTPFKQEKVLFGYAPAFEPNDITFDAGGRFYGRTFSRTATSTCPVGMLDHATIQTMNPGGFLTEVDIIAQAVANLPDVPGKPAGTRWNGCFRSGRSFEERVVFTADGDAYTYLDATLSNAGYGVLLHSHDRGRTWQGYWLTAVSPGWVAKLEFQGGQNELVGPPVILVNMLDNHMIDTWLNVLVDPTCDATPNTCTPANCPAPLPNTSSPSCKPTMRSGCAPLPTAYTSLYLIRPTKTPAGTLTIPAPVTISTDSLVVMQHSGASNTTVTIGTKTHIVYAAIHRDLSAKVCTRGTPVYARTYDSATGAVTPAVGNPGVFIGCGGVDETLSCADLGGPPAPPDNHNQPAVVVDYNNRLHVVLAGHHSSLQIASATSPNSTAAWTTPQIFGESNPLATPGGNYTYASVVLDHINTIHVAARWAGAGYYMRLVYLRGHLSGTTSWTWDTLDTAAGTKHKYLVVPFRPYYTVYYHKLNIDSRDRLFLTYETRGTQFTNQEAIQYCQTWPNDSVDGVPSCGATAFSSFALKPDVAGCSAPTGYCDYSTWSLEHEPALLLSQDSGTTWKLGTSADLAANETSYGIYVSPSTATGTFNTALAWWSGASLPFTYPWRKLADVTGDHKADLIGWANTRNGVYVVPSNGTGFDYASRWYGSDLPFTYDWRDVADVTGDGKADLVTGNNSGSDGVFVIPSNGGGFNYAANWHGTELPFQWEWRALSDVNGDGKADLVTWHATNSGVYVVPSNGTGFDFASRWYGGDLPFTWEWRMLGDVTGDGKADLVTWHDGAGVYVIPSSGVGFNYPARWYAGDLPFTYAWRTLADVNGDGKADLVTWNSTGSGIYVIPSNGAGFDFAARWYSGADQPFTWSNRLIVDVTGDGKADLVTWAHESSGVYVVPSTGSGFDINQRVYYGPNPPIQGVALLGDVTGDGRPDLVMQN